MSVAELAVSGMTCGSCSGAVTAALTSVEGVSSAEVSLVTERAIVHFTGQNAQVLVDAVEDCGFEAQIVNVSKTASQTEVCKVEVKIDGMTCGSCTASVRQAVGALEGVQSIEVSLSTDTAYIVCENNLEQEIITAIEDSGFDARLVSTTPISQPPQGSTKSHIELKLFGLSEALNVENELMPLNGIERAALYKTTLSIEYDTAIVGVRAIIRHIESLGLSALVASSADNSQQIAALNRAKELQSFSRDTIKTFCLGLPVILLLKLRKCIPSFLVAKVLRGVWADDIVGIVLVLPILFGPARRFYSKSYKVIKSGTLTMDVLVTVSVSCAFIYSVLALIIAVIVDMPTHQMYLWDACAMIIMFVLLGKYLENVARGQTSKALSDLISLVPEESLVVAEDTPETGQLMPTDMLQVNDVVILRPGERVSADGSVVEGESFISESLITGESKPVRKSVGDQVVGGTINGLGTLRFRVTRCGADTKLAQIVSFIKIAQASRAPIQRYADDAAAKFVPGVLGLALLTFSCWMLAGLVLGKERLPHMFHNQSLFLTCLRLGIAVVVVACPCALGLATPTAVMVGTGVGAKNGILVKGGSTFESGAQASAVLFDKTGTLTTGNMSVVAATIPAEHWSKVRAVEALSEHSIGKALSCYMHPEEPVQKHPLECKKVTVIPGKGIEGIVNGVKVFVGQQSAAQSDGLVHLVIENEDMGSITLKDSLRSDAPAVVESLQMQGFLVGIVSGDSPYVVEQLATELNIDEGYAWSQMKPEDKVEVIESLRSEGREVVFVGDGINDSPALVTASVGISLEGATHVAVESSDIVLTQTSPIAAVPAALDLCRATMKRIKRNLFMSLIYNAVMIPFAMGLLLHFNLMLSPMMASAAMALSSVSVVVSSLLLKLWKPTQLTYDDAPQSWFSMVRDHFTWRQKQYERV